jgi:hypothetical protein
MKIREPVDEQTDGEDKERAANDVPEEPAAIVAPLECAGPSKA